MCCETRAIAEMSKDETGLHTRFRHNVLVRQAVEAVTSHALALVAARNRQQLCDTRYAIVKRSVETGDLQRVGASYFLKFSQLGKVKTPMGHQVGLLRK
jgi:hypothetical protein